MEVQVSVPVAQQEVEIHLPEQVALLVSRVLGGLGQISVDSKIYLVHSELEGEEERAAGRPRLKKKS